MWQDIGCVNNMQSSQGSFVFRSEPFQAQNQPSSKQSDHLTISTLWTQDHLICLLETLCKQKFIDGIKFILTSHTTAIIYNAMSFESKIVFLNQFLVKMESRLDIEVKEVLFLKLT